MEYRANVVLNYWNSEDEKKGFEVWRQLIGKISRLQNFTIHTNINRFLYSQKEENIKQLRTTWLIRVRSWGKRTQNIMSSCTKTETDIQCRQHKECMFKLILMRTGSDLIKTNSPWLEQTLQLRPIRCHECSREQQCPDKTTCPPWTVKAVLLSLSTVHGGLRQ